MRTKNRGLTLAEVLMALGLLTFLVLTMIGVFVGGLRLMNRSELRTQASNMGSALMENLSEEGGYRALPESDSVFTGGPAVDGFPPNPYPGNDEFQISVETRELTSSTKACQVSVSWGEGSIKLEKVFNAVE